MWYDFYSKFEFWNRDDSVDVEFSHCCGNFTVSIFFNSWGRIEKETKDEKTAKKLFSEIVEYLQNTEKLDIQILANLFGKQEEK